MSISSIGQQSVNQPLHNSQQNFPVQKAPIKENSYIGPTENGKNHGIGILYLKPTPYLIEFAYGKPQRLLKIPQNIQKSLNSYDLILLHFAYPYWEEPSLSEEKRTEYYNDDNFNEIFVAVVYEKKLLFNGRLFNQKKICFDYEENDNEIYIGEFKKGIRSGIGLLVKKGKFKYEGEFIDGKPSGNGIIYDGFIYTGENKIRGDMKNGKFNGFGEVVFSGNHSYTGEMRDNMFDGFGVYHYDDKDLYLGEFQRNKRHGNGIFYSGGKVEYDGKWINDEKARLDE